MSTKLRIRRALISTSNKAGLVEFAKQLVGYGIEIIATGGTAKLLTNHQIPIVDVADYTGFPEIMNGRVKTLHPKIHGGILARRGIDDEILNHHHIPPIDLVVVNLYPFRETISKPNCDFSQAIEQIDIGGPTLLRAAAKNHQSVTVVVDPNDYATLLTEIREQGTTSLQTRQHLALKTFQHTADYDHAIADYFATQIDSEEKTNSLFPTHLQLNLNKKYDLRYGENPHQAAAFYQPESVSSGSLSTAELLQGKPLSYNNLIDADTAFRCVKAFDKKKSACVIIKHATPCGVALGENLIQAYQKALATDSTSAFGGIIAVNQTIDEQIATTILNQQFVEVLIAPGFTKNALIALQKKINLRVLAYQPTEHQASTQEFHSISGGILAQESDQLILNPNDLKVVSKREPTEQELADLLFAWQVVTFVKSNAIVYVKNQSTYGIGSGQTSRVFSAKIAEIKAKEANLSLIGAVMASDAFFPFADGVEVAAKAGISAVIQPGGSKRDQEVIDAVDKAGMAMLFTGNRHFRH